MATKDVMIDIETLATTADAVVLSIGAVKFDCSDPSGPTFSDLFLSVPTIAEQVLLGRRVDPKTQAWWAKQDPSVAAHWVGGDHQPLNIVLERFAAFVKDAERIWANGIVFDMGILENLYLQAGMPVPWAYNVARDARTFYDVMPHTRDYSPPEAINTTAAHHPVVDCRVQVMRLWEHGFNG